MSGTTVLCEITGVQETIDALGGVETRLVSRGLRRAMDAGLAPVLARAFQLVPLDTGSLAGSLAAKSKSYAGGRVVVGLVGPERGHVQIKTFTGGQRKQMTTRYAHMVEFGTSGMAARPYLRPAWDAGKDEFLDAFIVELDSELRRAATP